MFTVRVTVNGTTLNYNFEKCSDAWQEFASAIQDASFVMECCSETGDIFNLQNIRMAYMIDTISEVEYANVVIA